MLTEILSKFGVNWSAFIAQIILFLIMYLFLDRYVFSPFLKILEERRKRIEESQINADKIKKQLAEVELRYQEILNKAHLESKLLLEETHKQTEAFASQERTLIKKEIELMLENARHDIQLERISMMDEVKQGTLNLVLKAISQMTGKVLSHEDHNLIAQKVISDLSMEK